MENEKPTPPPSEVKQAPMDISDRVRAMFTNPDARQGQAIKESIALHRDLEGVTTLTLTLDYTTLNHAKFLKALLERQPLGGDWKFSIRATESQMKEAANVFASGVEWIQVED